MPTASSKLRLVKCKPFTGELLVANDCNRYLSSFGIGLFRVSSMGDSSVMAVKSHNFIVQSNEPEKQCLI